MKMQVRIIDKDDIVVKIGQKRKGWIRVRFKSLEMKDPGCQICDFSKTCNRHDPICAAIISEIAAKEYYFTTPPHFCLAINDETGSD